MPQYIWFCRGCKRRDDMQKLDAKVAVFEHGVVSPECGDLVRFVDLQTVTDPKLRKEIEDYKPAADE